MLNLPDYYILASWNEMKEAKAKGLDVPRFYLASWESLIIILNSL